MQAAYSSNEEQKAGYILPAAKDSQAEISRLDEMHAALTSYIGGLSRAPLHEIAPKKILELGCGLGTRRRKQTTSPPTTISPNPSRPSLRRRAATATPHTAYNLLRRRRLVSKLPKQQEALTRVASLLAPNGVLIIEEMEPGSTLTTAQGYSLDIMKLMDALYKRKVGADAGSLGSQLGELMGALDGFKREVHRRV
ncbi:S-adenosyl-L-methionine-dependent methyltransferase [Mycena kentingensis (nom. inval.)]|nr:S-adenosyl-L-methionine-dependent methyltransferase [Mycena kentingensis (nom. inval.)]